MGRPTRVDLLGVISEVQRLVGEATADHGNDRDRDGFEKGQKALETALALCIGARAFDPPEAGSRSVFLQDLLARRRP